MMTEYFPHKVLWYKSTGKDKFAKSTYEDCEEIPCRYVGGMKLIRDKNGKEIMSAGHFKLVELVELDDKLIYNGQDMFIANYVDIYDLDGLLVYRKVWV